MMRLRPLMIALALTAIAVTPVVHHHAVSTTDGGDLSYLQTVCAVCLHAHAIVPPDATTLPVLESADRIVAAPCSEHASFEPSLTPSRAPPRIA